MNVVATPDSEGQEALGARVTDGINTRNRT